MNQASGLSLKSFKKFEEILEIKGDEDHTKLIEMLKKVNAPSTLEDIGVASEYKEKILRFSPFVRNRLTFMRLLHLFETE